MNFQLITDIVSLVLLAMGGVLVFATAIGLVRFKDTMSRVHPVTKPQTLGLVITIPVSYTHLTLPTICSV